MPQPPEGCLWVREALTVLELGLALLGECARPFLGVLAAEDGEPDLPLDRERVVLRQALGLPDGAQDGAYRHRSVRRDLVRDLQCGRQRGPIRHYPTDQADRQSLGGIDVPPGEQQVTG